MRTILSLTTAGLILVTSTLLGNENWVDQPTATYVFDHPNIGVGPSGGPPNRFADPEDAVVDPTTGKVFVADTGNNRVLRYDSLDAWSQGAQAEVVLGQQDFSKIAASNSAWGMNQPCGLACQEDGTLWVADSGNSRVLRFDEASMKASGASADGVLGQSGFGQSTPGLSQSAMDTPSDVAIDAEGNLFVSSRENNRVLVFGAAAGLPAGADAALVLGQYNYTSNESEGGAAGMSGPEGVAVDQNGSLYVSDSENHRILRFDDLVNKSNGADADVVFGSSVFVLPRSGRVPMLGLSNPSKIAINQSGRLWVVDTNHHRVVGFSGAATSTENVVYPDRVIGQPDIYTDTPGTGDNELGLPKGVSLDPDGNMWVSDTGNDRVLVFESTLFDEPVAEPTFRSDSMVGKSLTSLKGDDIYDPSGNSQKHTEKTKGKEAKFFVTIQNDGNSPDSFTVASAKTNKKIKIKVYALTGGRVNVSAAAKIGALGTGTIDPGESLSYEVKGRPKGKYKDKKHTHPIWLQATSVAGGGIDRVNGKAKHRP